MTYAVQTALTLADMPVWAVAILLVVGAGIGAYAGSYLKEAGRSKALLEGFDQVLNQVRATTEATETIRREISHGDWSNRERKTLLRAKLEELLAGTYELHRWLKAIQRGLLFKAPYEQPDKPDQHLTMLATLYFPVIRRDVLRVVAAADVAQLGLMEAHGKLLEQDLSPEKKTEIRNMATAPFMEQYEEFLRAVATLEAVSMALVEAYIGEPSTHEQIVSEKVVAARQFVSERYAARKAIQKPSGDAEVA